MQLIVRIVFHYFTFMSFDISLFPKNAVLIISNMFPAHSFLLVISHFLLYLSLNILYVLPALFFSSSRIFVFSLYFVRFILANYSSTTVRLFYKFATRAMLFINFSSIICVDLMFQYSYVCFFILSLAFFIASSSTSEKRSDLTHIPF